MRGANQSRIIPGGFFLAAALVIAGCVRLEFHEPLADFSPELLTALYFLAALSALAGVAIIFRPTRLLPDLTKCPKCKCDLPGGIDAGCPECGWNRIDEGTTCPICSYDLRGDLKSGCPECGWNRATGFTTENTEITEKQK